MTDDQLVDLFNDMKKETMAKREKEMKKFKVETPVGETTGGLDLIDEFNDELDAMRGEDSEPEDGGLIGESTSPFRIGVAQPYTAEQEPEVAIKYYNNDIKEQLRRYREQKKLEE